MQFSGESPLLSRRRGRAPSSGKVAGVATGLFSAERSKVYARGGLGFLAKYGKDYTYEGMLESILAELPGKPKYVVIVSGGNDVYGPEKSAHEEEYQDAQVALAMAKVATRLYYQRIPGLFVFGANSECFQYTGKKGQVFDRRVGSVRRLADRIFSACWLQYSHQVVSGITQLVPLLDAVDGIDHYGGTEDVYDKLKVALAQFCMMAQALVRSRL